MRSITWLLGLSRALLRPRSGPVDAERRQAMPRVPRLGDIVPSLIRVIGVDGESIPGRHEKLIIDGRFIVLMEASGRRVVEIIPDAPLSPSAVWAR